MYFLYTVNGNSMFPTLRHQDLALVDARAMPNRLKLGDIVVYENMAASEGKKQVIHRVVWKKNGYYIVRGDNAIGCDFVNINNIRGPVCSIYRQKQEIKFNPYVTRIFFVLIGCLIALGIGIKRRIANG